METVEIQPFFCVCDKTAILSQNVKTSFTFDDHAFSRDGTWMKTLPDFPVLGEKGNSALETIRALGYISKSYSMGKSESF